MPEETSAQRLVAAISAMIASGEIGGGAWLDEVSLAKKFEVSRTPVREALTELVSRGILVARERRGVQVADITQEKLAEMYEAMSEIEALCARLAAHRISWLQRVELEEAHRDCLKAAAANDRPAFIEANDRFHTAIYRATQNSYIERMASEFRRNTAPFRGRRFRSEDELKAAAAAHTRILAAVTGARSEEAFTDMRSHITETGLKALTGR